MAAHALPSEFPSPSARISETGGLSESTDSKCATDSERLLPGDARAGPFGG